MAQLQGLVTVSASSGVNTDVYTSINGSNITQFSQIFNVVLTGTADASSLLQGLAAQQQQQAGSAGFGGAQQQQQQAAALLQQGTLVGGTAGLMLTGLITGSKSPGQPFQVAITNLKTSTASCQALNQVQGHAVSTVVTTL